MRIRITLMVFNDGSWIVWQARKFNVWCKYIWKNLTNTILLLEVWWYQYFEYFTLKKGHWVKHGVEAKTLVRTMLTTEGILAIWFVVMSNADYGQLRIDNYMLIMHRPIGLMLDEYAKSRRNYHETGLYWWSVRIFSSFSMIVMMVTETIIYIIFIQHMYKNNDNWNILRSCLLEPSVIRRRNRTSV